MRPRRSKLRAFLKWAGLVACVFVLAIWVASFAVPVYPSWLKGDETWFVGVGKGLVECYYQAGVFVHRLGSLFRGESETHWRPILRRTTIGNRTGWYVCLPLWVPLLVLVIPTALLWWRDRRPPPGFCQVCGYNLTGLPEPRCPECSQPFDEEATT